MSFHIIVKGDGSKPSSKGGRRGFTPHWNYSIGKKPVFISSPTQYDRELKSRGLEPYTGENQDHKLPQKEYKVTRETRALVNAIKDHTDRNGKLHPSGSLTHELKSRGVLKTHSEIEKLKKKLPPNWKEGGFHAAD